MQSVLHRSEVRPRPGLLPNVITYSATITACEMGHKPQQALPLLQTLQLRGLLSSVITDQAAISTCEKGQKPQHALHMLPKLPLIDLRPNVITYNAAISACETGHKPQPARISCRRCSLTPLPTAQYQRLRQGPNG